MAAFTPCMTFVKKWEGGYVVDDGGPTNYGITRATLSKWRRYSCSALDVENLTWAEAEQIYIAWYWLPVEAENMPAGVDLMVFNMAVNAGDNVSEKLLQGCLGVVVDGCIGPKTLAAARAADPVRLVSSLAAAQLAFYQSLRTWPLYADGWQARLSDAQSTALSLIAQPHIALRGSQERIGTQ